MADLAASLEQARDLDVEELADSIQELGFACTQCGNCCRGEEDDAHVATIYPDEVRSLQASENLAWRDVARPMPYGLAADGSGETFEWALAADGCGDCTFLREKPDGTTSCGVYTDRPGICRTYPFQVDLAGTTAPQASVDEREGNVLAYECEGLGTAIDRADARSLAVDLKRRTVRDVEEARAVLDRYEPSDRTTVVHDSEGAKRPDGHPIGES